MELKIERCKKCDRKTPIVNRKYQLCQQCNWERLHPVEGSYSSNRKKQQVKLLRSLQANLKPIKSRTRLSQMSTKQRQVARDLADVYKEISIMRIKVCTGCGTEHRLSHSHLIPRSRRKDLEASHANITYHCLSMGDTKGCHDIWEHGSIDDKKMLNDFEKSMQYIKAVDSEYYYLLLKNDS